MQTSLCPWAWTALLRVWSISRGDVLGVEPRPSVLSFMKLVVVERSPCLFHVYASQTKRHRRSQTGGERERSRRKDVYPSSWSGVWLISIGSCARGVGANFLDVFLLASFFMSVECLSCISSDQLNIRWVRFMACFLWRGTPA